MLRRTKKHQKKLARLVLATLLFTGAAHGLMSPSVAEAADPVTVTGYASGNFAPDSSKMRSYYYDYSYYYAPTDGTVTELYLAQGTAQGAWSNPGIVAGHYGSGASGASGVTVNMTGTDVVVSNLYGGLAVGTGSSSTDLGTASNNIVNISAGTVATRVAGGYSSTKSYAIDEYYYTCYGGNADGNTVTISGDDTKVGEVSGGLSDFGGANNNTVIVENGVNTKSVYGGESSYYYYYGLNTDVSGNTVTIRDNAKIDGTVRGGYSGAEPSNTTGLDPSANANDNKVTISDKVEVTGSVYGGYTYGYYTADASADRNEVIIEGDVSVGGSVFGGYTSSSYYVADSDSYIGGSADDNTVTISGKAVGGFVYGGSSYYGSADSNVVTISGETVISGKGEYDYGYYVTVKIYGGSTSYGNADGNKVSVRENVSVGVDTNRVYIYGGSSSSGNADGNIVTVSDAAAIGEKSADYGYVYLYGGYTGYSNYSKNNGSTDGNTVTIIDNAVIGSNSSTGSYVEIYGGYGYYGSTSNNTVTIGDDAVVGNNSYANVYGAHSYGAANENLVDISGNAIVGEKGANVYGAYSYGASTGNTVTISGKAAVGSEGSAHIYGSYTGYGAEGDIVNNNTVTISGEAVVGYGYVIGASSSYGTASKNTVTISEKAVVGGASDERINGGSSSYGSADSNIVTIRDEAAVSSASQLYIYGGSTSYGASADNNTVTIRDKAAVTGVSRLDISGGYSTYGSAGNNSVVFSDDTAVTISKNAESTAETQMRISGGYSTYGSADKNEIAVSENAVVGSGADRVYIFGGFSQNAAETSNENKVTVSGKAAVGSDASYVSIYGGGGIIDTIYTYYVSYTYSTAAADKNTVIISDNSAVGSNASNTSVYGGYSYSSSANENKVTISDGVVVGSDYAYIYGGYAGGNGSAGTEASVNADKNMVTISGNAVVGGDYAASIYGGISNSNKGSANENTITISDNAVVGGDYAYIRGAYGSAIANDNTVTISGNASVAAGSDAHESYAYVTITGADVSAYGVDGGGAKNNTVTISGDAVVGPDAYYVQIQGAVSSYGIVSDNTVTISDNAAVASGSTDENSYSYMTITGGTSYYGIAKDNTVTISGKATFGSADNYKTNSIIGGSSYIEASGNTVEIEGDAKVYAGAVVGGYASSYYEGTAATNSNTVTISAEVTEAGLVYGGRTTRGDASKNKVTMTAGSVTGKIDYPGVYYGIAAVAGGYVVKNGNATSNTVEINGVTVSVPEEDGADSSTASSSSGSTSITMAVVGGYAGTGNATGNTVKLTDATITGGVYGGAGESPSDTGDSSTGGAGLSESGSGESGSNTRDLVTGNTLVVGGINTVDGEVTNFETIKLADTVEWNTEVPVLKASQFTINGDEDGTRASLDITGAESNLAAGTSGRMTLLASETKNDFATLTLKSTEGADNLSETNPYKVLSATSETSSKADGVAVKFQGEHKVSLDAEDNYKNVLYTVENKAKEISLETMTWNTGRDLAGAYAFDGTIPVDATNLAFKSITTALKPNDSMTLVSNATGLTSANTVKNGTGRTVGINYTDSGSGIGYEATASGNVTAGTGVVTYTVDSVTADKITLASRAWGAAADEMPEAWKASASTQIDAAKFAYTGEATTALKKNDTATILNASGLTTASPVTVGADKTVAVNYTDTSGINFAATANGHVAAAKNAVNYVVDGVEVNSVNLAKWNGTHTSAVTEGWTGSGVAVTGSFTAPTDLAAGSARDIVTAIGGFFTDDNIDEAIRYGQGDAFRETENNVTVAGHKVGGVKAEDEGAKLAYYAMEKSAETMTFGKIAFAKDGMARDLKNAYVFDSSSVINATDLTFTETTEALNKDDSMTLAANAMGITEKNVVTQPADPDVPIAYTDSAGIKFGAAASGTVEAAADAVNYVVDSVAVNSIDLAGWSGTVSAVTAGWTLADGAAVETDGMTAPTLAPGKSADILTGASDGFFANATVKGENKYQATMFNEEDSGITFKGTQKKGVKAEGKSLVYVAAGKIVDTAAMSGEIAWNPGGTYYENTKYDFTADSEIDVSGVKFTTDADPLDQSMTLIGNADGTVKDGTPEFMVKLSNTALETTAAGEAAIAAGNLNYKVTSVTLNKVTVNEAGSDTVPEGWTFNFEGVKVDTETMKVPTDVAPGEEKPILSGGAAGTFKDEDIIGANAYKETAFTDASNPDDTSKGVVLEGTQGKGVKASDDGTGLVYATGKKEVSAVNAGVTDWQPGATLLDGSAGYDYTNVTSIDAGGFDVTFNKPEEIAAGESMTLLKANETLADMAAQEKSTNYSFEPVSGVTVDAAIAASLTVKNGIVTYTPSENKAGKLSFGDVLWNADKPLLTRPDNITFAGADVDTSKINFTNVLYLDANQEMTLVSGFGDSVGTITGGTYMVGTAFIGEGIASLSGSNLIFTTLTEAGLSEQTHKTVMAMDAGLAMLKTGNEFVGRAMDGLADVKNAGRDGISTFAAIGGGASRYNTGSHVNTHTWNAVVGVGKTSETKNGSMEWGVFGEYGKGSYTVHSAVGDGDGDAHYAGGGLLAKWTNKHDVYTEASVRAGRLSDSSSDIMQDSLGNKYGYNVHANYYGGHIGVGKIINYKGGRNLDVYGKFFYLKREGVEYDAPQQYNLDSVASSILRLGARYGTTDKKWNWYGGLAYEYEFDGEATGTVKGKEIRAASIKGSSVRGEFGMRMEATKTNPWSADISLYGYGGKHRGFGGNVSVMYTF